MEQSILVVEDDEMLASNIQTYLERKGNEVKVCHNAEAALEALPGFEPDVVLTDNSLPGMSGLELIRELQEPVPQVQVIMMIGYGNIDDAVSAM